MPNDLTDLLRDHARFVEARCPDGEAVARDMLEAAVEIERLRADRQQVESYLRAVASCARIHPEGYTIVDFQQVWLDQERDKATRLEAEIERLTAWIERTATCKYLRKQGGYHGRRVSMEAERMLSEPGWFPVKREAAEAAKEKDSGPAND